LLQTQALLVEHLGQYVTDLGRKRTRKNLRSSIEDYVECFSTCPKIPLQEPPHIALKQMNELSKRRLQNQSTIPQLMQSYHSQDRELSRRINHVEKDSVNAGNLIIIHKRD